MNGSWQLQILSPPAPLPSAVCVQFETLSPSAPAPQATSLSTLKNCGVGEVLVVSCLTLIDSLYFF